MTIHQFKEIGKDFMTELTKPDGRAVSISFARSSEFSRGKEY